MGNEILVAAAKSSSSGGNFLLLPIFIALLAFMYFVMIRPQRNRQRAVQQAQRELEPGMEVRTTAGIYGTLTSVDGDNVMLEIAPGVEIRLLRRAIMDVVPDASLDEAMEEPGDEDGADEAGDATAGDGTAGQAEAGVTANEPGSASVEDSETLGGPGAASNGSGRSSAGKGQPAG